MTDFPPIVFENQVRFAETDLQGIVFFGAFFTYMDETYSAYCREIGHPYSQLSGWTTHVAHADLDYHDQATFEDILENGMRITKIGTASITAEYAVRHKHDETRIASGDMIHVAVDPATDEVIPVPNAFREAVTDYQTTPPD